jgi:hypothetical protein
VKRIGATLVVAFVLAGCASVPLVSPEEDARVKSLPVAPDRAGIFIFRDGWGAPGVKLQVSLDGAPLGQTVPRTYLFREVAPGRHVVTSWAENADTLELDVAAGSFAFVRQEPVMGFWSARSKLHLVDETEGKIGVRDSVLAESRISTQSIDVRFEIDDPDWRGTLECVASNSFGSWTFATPGSVVVATSNTPLRISCRLAAGASGAIVEDATLTPQSVVRKGAITGATAGAVVGAALAVAAAPIMGPAFAVALAAGAAMRGAEVGALVAGATAEDTFQYPGAAVIKLTRTAPPD